MISTVMSASVPLMIFFIVSISFKEKKKTFENFLEGAKSSISILLEIFPTLIGLFVAINMLRVSGVLNFIVNNGGKIYEKEKISPVKIRQKRRHICAKYH